METTAINQVLAQMRSIESAAKQGDTNLEVGGANRGSFENLLKDTINQVNDNQIQAKELTDAFSEGVKGVDLPDVMVAVQKSSVSFQAVSQVRNQLLSAYREVMSMQV